MPTEAELQAELEKLRAENQALKTQKTKPVGISYKVSEKGGLSVYGMGRFPVTLYKEQWATLFDHAEEIRQFIKDNESKFKTKDAKE